MKRRRQARLDQQPRRTAVRRSTRQPGPAALSPTCLRAAGSISLGNLLQQSSSARPAISRLSTLERVICDVLVLILQYLTGRHKLTAICRLSRAFRSLPTLAFVRDSPKDLLHAVGLVWAVKRGTRGAVSSFSMSVTQPEQEGRTTLFTCPRSLGCLPHFAALKALRISVGLPVVEADRAAPLRCILRSVLSLPSLTQLTIRSQDQMQADWTDCALPSTVTLRHLTLTKLSLSAASVLRLFSLPLESLDVVSCTVLPGDDSALVKAERPVSGGALKRLKLPSCALTHSTRTLQLYVRWLQRSRSPLEQLNCSCLLSAELLGLIASHLQQLRELDLKACPVDLCSGPALDFSPLLTASAAPRLPMLTKLAFPIFFGFPDLWSTALWRPELVQTFITASQQLVAAYSAQLTSLDITFVSGGSINTWLRLLLGRCHLLTELQLEYVPAQRVRHYEPPLEAVELQSAPASTERVVSGLQRLRLQYLPLTDGSLLTLLSSCPQLNYCELNDLPHVTVAGKAAAFRCCPNLQAQ